jgi:hypothetical protein
VSLGLLLSVATLAVFWRDNGVSKITISFVNAETSYAAGPPLWNVECERLGLAVRNDGKTPVRFEVSDINDEHGNWFPSFQVLEGVAAGKTTQLYLYLPKGSHSQALRMRGYKKATTVEKAQYALRLLIEKISGRYPGKQVWFEKLSVPAYEFIVKIDTKAEPDAAANQSQPIRSETKSTSSAAGSRR